MKKVLFSGALLVGLFVATSPAAGQEPITEEQEKKGYLEGEVVVLGTRPGQLTPVTKQTIRLEELQKSTTAWDVPSMLVGTPSLLTTSDSGLTGGYTGFSIRGVDPTRVNITVNGVPVNDSESQAVFWANMPDFGSRLADIVIVRGAGSSTFGAGAFGATMDMQLALPALEAGGALSLYGGSYGLNRQLIELHSGTLGSGWRLSGMLSRVASNGYVERSNSSGLSYLAQAYYGGSNYSLQFIHHAGDQKTGISWNGISEANEKKFGRTFNDAGWMNPDEEDRAKYQYYDDQTDNYKQAHTYATFKHFLDNGWQYGVTLHHTRGVGFTKEYRTGRRYREYYLVPMSDGKRGSLIREKYLDNHFFGGIVNATWKGGRAQISTGGSLNHYFGDHFGKLPYVADPAISYTPNQEYYRNHSTRSDGAVYVKGELNLTSRWLLYADIMYRYVRATMEGPTDRKNDHTGAMDVLDFVGANALQYHFVLPKVGVNFHPTRSMELYLSYATAGKEPNRKMYTESKRYTSQGELLMPRPEYMGDLEVGGSWRNRTLQLFVNGYWMHYKDQIVPNGQLSDVGEPLMVNVPNSYRLGVELGFAWQIHPSLSISANGTLSRNRIVDYTYYEDVYNADWDWVRSEELHLGEAPISMSPALIANHTITWEPLSKLSIQLGGHYVGKRFMDNSGLDSRALHSYYTGNLMVNYAWDFLSEQRLELQLQVNNLYNSLHYNNGWTYGYIVEETQGNQKRVADKGHFPSAPIHFVLGATLHF